MFRAGVSCAVRLCYLCVLEFAKMGLNMELSGCRESEWGIVLCFVCVMDCGCGSDGC